MTIHNRTPHPITILAADAPADSPPALELPAAGRGQIARVETTAHTVGTISVLATSPHSRASERTLPEAPPLDRDVAQIDVVSQCWGRVVGLADTDEPQVVSAIVAAAMQAHGHSLVNVFVPADQVRDDKGRIVGCRGLLRAADAVPRLGPPPQVVVFGSALNHEKFARGRVSRRACFQASRSSRNRAIIAPPETTMREPDHGRAEYGAAPPQKKAWPGIQNFIPLASTRIHLHPPGRAPRSNPMRSHRRDEARTTTAMELATRSLPVVSSPIASVFARTKDNSARQRGTDARCRSCGP